jgi:hypothetical protein
MFDKIKKFFITEDPTEATNDGTPAWAVGHVPPHPLPEITVTIPMPPVEPPKEEKVKKPRAKRKPKEAIVELPPMSLTPAEIAKAEATAKGDPWVTVISLDMDMDNVGAGSFNLDWNDIFVARLVKAGYRGADDVQIVDQWFTDLARNIALETFQQEQADPEKRK